MPANVNNAALTEVEERLNNLHALKEVHSLQTRSQGWLRKANIKEVNDPGRDDYRTQISATVKMQKDAELLSAVPEWSFIPLDGDGRTNRKIIKPTWDYHWMVSETDRHISDVIQSATTNGTGILEEGIRHSYKYKKMPKIIVEEIDGEEIKTIEYEKELVMEKSGIFCERIPFQNFFINGTSLDNSTEAAVVEYFDKDDYIAEKELDPQYKNLDQVKTSNKGFNIVSGTVGDHFDETTTDNTVIEIRYYNSAKDEFKVVANGIEVRDTPIPYAHKKLPFALYIDNKADDRIWGIGEFELLEQEERTKNDLRSLLIKGVKFSIGLVLKDRNADIEEDEMTSGIGETLETDDMNGIKQITFQVPVRDIADIESKLDNDIIAKSGVDFKSQLLAPAETATRTASKSKSSQKRINKNIKDNAYNFYRRLAELRMSNIQFLHEASTQEIPIEGGSIEADGTFVQEEGGGFGSAIIGKELTKGKFLILPIVETMLGNSKARRREESLQYAQIVGNISGEEGTPVIKGRQLAKLITEEFGFDFEKLTESSGAFKSPEETLKEFKKQIQGTKGTELDENFVPPEQRRQQEQVKTISGVSNLPAEE